MIGLVLITHGRLAEEFVAAAEHVVGPQGQIACVCIGPDDALDVRKTEILDKAAGVNTGDGVILLTDMFGGTPSNLAIAAMEHTGAEVIAGLNLPMLIKLASVRDRLPLNEAVQAAQEAGRKYISVASWILSGHDL